MENESINKAMARITYGMFLIFLLAVFLLIFSLTHARAALQDCTINFQANTEADLAGYRVYGQNKGAGQYIKGQYQGEVGKERTSVKCSELNLPMVPGTFYFSLTAFDNARNESEFSNEVSKALTEVPDVGAPGFITNLKVEPGAEPGTLIVSLTVPDDGAGKPAMVDVRYQEGQMIAWGGATQFACPSFPCTIIGLKQGLEYTLQCIPVRREAGKPSVFGKFTVPTTTKTGSGQPPIDPPPVKPLILDITLKDGNGNVLLAETREIKLK